VVYNKLAKIRGLGRVWILFTSVDQLGMSIKKVVASWTLQCVALHLNAKQTISCEHRRMLRRMLRNLSVTLCLGLLPSVLVSSASAQQRTTQGAAVGGAAGAIIGGIIGHQNDETPEGALIGGAVGAITGGLIGRNQDNMARERYNQQQAYNQRVYVQQQAIVPAGATVSDIISMSRSGLSESLIVSHINSKGVQRRLEVSEIITLHQQGVSDYVISAMQSAPLANQIAAPYQTQHIVTQPSTVIVREQPVIYSSPVITETYYRPTPVYRSHQHYYAPRGRF